MCKTLMKPVHRLTGNREHTLTRVPFFLYFFSRQHAAVNRRLNRVGSKLWRERQSPDVESNSERK